MEQEEAPRAGQGGGFSLLFSKERLLALAHNNLADMSGLWVAQRGLLQQVTSDLANAPLPRHLLVGLIKHNWKESKAEASGAK